MTEQNQELTLNLEPEYIFLLTIKKAICFVGHHEKA